MMDFESLTWKEYIKLSDLEQGAVQMYYLTRYRFKELEELYVGHDFIQWKATKGGETVYFCDGIEIKKFFKDDTLKRYVGKCIDGWKIERARGCQYFKYKKLVGFVKEILLNDEDYKELGEPVLS